MNKLFNQVNKKLFLILLGFIGAIIFIFIFIAIYKNFSERDVSYSKLEDMMIKSATAYYKKNNLPAVDGEIKIVEIDKLVIDGYLKSLDKLITDKTCDGNVTVKNNGGHYLYTPKLKCADYKTKTLGDAIKTNIVTKDSGLYEINGEYVFKGEKVNNYVSFAGSIWRIIEIDKNGFVKLVKSEEEKHQNLWDDRYNIETKRTSGINDYKLSRIKEKLNNIYNEQKLFSENEKKHIVSVDLCVGKRSETNLSLDDSDLCNEILEDQFISLVNVTEVARASIDENCKKLGNGACQNYNYLSDFIISTWTITGVLENTSEVYYVVKGLNYRDEARQRQSMFIVVHVDSNERYIKGNGTKADPFVIN